MTASSEMREIAVITGASTGMGAATARELARRGVRRDRNADAIRGPVYRVMQDSCAFSGRDNRAKIVGQ